MGKKMYIKPDQLGKNIERIELEKVIRFNRDKIDQYLQSNGYEIINTSPTSKYYIRKGNSTGIIRTSDHENISEFHLAPSVNGYSNKKDGWLEIIKQIKELESYSENK